MPPVHEHIDRQFRDIGARARLITRQTEAVALDVRRDRRSEYFNLSVPEAASVEVLDVDRSDRHLLLFVAASGEKSRFLCGHDERHWFVAAIPESASGIVNVRAAKQALQPVAVRNVAVQLRRNERNRRRNRAFSRQGEWFFVPAFEVNPHPWLVLHHEPLSRGRGKSHVMEFAYRRGGSAVYVSRQNPNGLTQDEYDILPEKVRKAQSWRQMVRDAAVFAMGRIRHPDHATLHLHGWHRVFMNTEPGARAMRQVAFLD